MTNDATTAPLRELNKSNRSPSLTTTGTGHGAGLALRMTGFSVKEIPPTRNQLTAPAAGPTRAMIIPSPDADGVHRGYDSIAIGTDFHKTIPLLKDNEKNKKNQPFPANQQAQLAISRAVPSEATCHLNHSRV